MNADEQVKLKMPLPAPPADMPRRGDAFRHWKHGATYVVTGRSRNEQFPDSFDVLYLPEGASEETDIPWRRTYEDFMNEVVHPDDVGKPKARTVRRFAPDGRRDLSSVRREVLVFARAMEEKLKANEHKGGWKNEHPFDMLERVVDEIDELDVALQALDSDRSSAEKVAKVLSEAADVANFCMFVADVVGALGPQLVPAGG